MLIAWYFRNYLDTFNLMFYRSIILSCIILVASQFHLSSQSIDSTMILSGIVYDEDFYPVPASHIINLNSHQGEVSDSLGIFNLPVKLTDTLLIRNIAFKDALVPVSQIFDQKFIIIKRKYYDLQEAKIFQWGSSYTDFKEAVVKMPNQQTLGESMGLPRQDPDYIPFEMNEEAIKSFGFLITTPISYLYHNFNKHARSARKVFWLQKNDAQHKVFNEILDRENISSITGLTGTDLQNFRTYLNGRLICDYRCTELQIYTEIHANWEIYQKLHMN